MNPPANQTPIGLDQHSLFVGMTDGGKTTRMVRQFLWVWARLNRYGVPNTRFKIVIVDTKDVADGPGRSNVNGNFHWLTRAPWNARVEHEWRDDALGMGDPETRIVIYRPPEEDIHPENFEAFFRWLTNVRVGKTADGSTAFPFLCVIDELLDIVSGERARVRYLHDFTRIMRQGRQAKRVFMIGTQNVVFLDTDIMRQTAVKFIFTLATDEDRERISKNFNDKRVRNVIPDPHGFYYSNTRITSTRTHPWYFSGKDD